MRFCSTYEIPVNDLDKAKAFYEAILGVEISLNEMGPLKMGWFPMVQEAPGATGALVKAEGYTPSHAGTLVYFHVADIEATLEKVNNKSGKMLMPKTPIGEHGFVAHFEDCEGNRVAIHCEQ